MRPIIDKNSSPSQEFSEASAVMAKEKAIITEESETESLLFQ